MFTKQKSLILFSNHFKVRLFFFVVVGAKRIAIKMALKILFEEEKKLNNLVVKSVCVWLV